MEALEDLERGKGIYVDIRLRRRSVGLARKAPRESTEGALPSSTVNTETGRGSRRESAERRRRVIKKKKGKGSCRG
jgi:hypothetical protein